MKVIATIGSGPMRPVLDVAMPHMEAFAARHGYSIEVGDGDSGGRPPAWAKVLLLARLLNEHALVLWLDADTLILNDSEDPADLLPPWAFQGLVEHVASTGSRLPNTGVWLLKGNDRAAAFLDAVWNAEKFIKHRWWENAAVLDLLGYSTGDDGPCWPMHPNEWSAETFWMPLRWNQITWLGHHGRPAVRHYAGTKNDVRVMQMQRDLRRSSLEWRLRGVADHVLPSSVVDAGSRLVRKASRLRDRLR